MASSSFGPSATGNADRVDGRHAVGSGASRSKRSGKLVATNGSGYLPNNIIRKARDSDKVDGFHSSAFAKAQALKSSAGAVNQADNPVHWKQLKGVPVGIADGDDTGYVSGLTPWEGPPLVAGNRAAVVFQNFPRHWQVLFNVIPSSPVAILKVDEVEVLREPDDQLRYFVWVLNTAGDASAFKVRWVAFFSGIAPAGANVAQQVADIKVTVKKQKKRGKKRRGKKRG